MKTNITKIINELTSDLVDTIVLLVEAEEDERYEDAKHINEIIDQRIQIHAEYFELVMPGKKDNFLDLMAKHKLILIKKIKENIDLINE
jgi:hypothetical protein